LPAHALDIRRTMLESFLLDTMLNERQSLNMDFAFALVVVDAIPKTQELLVEFRADEHSVDAVVG
jgi:hypothetical protein